MSELNDHPPPQHKPISTKPTPQNQPTQKNIWLNISGLVMIIALVAIGLAYALDAAVRSASNKAELGDTGPKINKVIAGQKLQIPMDWLNPTNQSHDEFVDRVTILLPLKFSPQGPQYLIGATLESSSKSRASARLLDTVYAHQFQDAQLSGAKGLIGKRLSEKDGFQQETVWYDPIAPNPFVAKCTNPVTPTATGKCLRTLVLPTGLALMLNFDENLLSNWGQMDTALAVPLREIGIEFSE